MCMKVCFVYGKEIDKILVHPTGVHQIDWIKKSSDLILNDMKTFQMKWNEMEWFVSIMVYKLKSMTVDIFIQRIDYYYYYYYCHNFFCLCSIRTHLQGVYPLWTLQLSSPFIVLFDLVVVQNERTRVYFHILIHIRVN